MMMVMVMVMMTTAISIWKSAAPPPARPSCPGVTPTMESKTIVTNLFVVIIIFTRPKPPYGRQGLAGSWSKDRVRRVHFGVLSRSSKNAIGRLEKDFNLNAVFKSRWRHTVFLHICIEGMTRTNTKESDKTNRAHFLHQDRLENNVFHGGWHLLLAKSNPALLFRLHRRTPASLLTFFKERSTLLDTLPNLK